MAEKNQHNDIIFYTSPEGNVNIEVIYNNETFLLSQKRMAEFFGCSTDNILLHIKNIFKDKELDTNSVAEEISATAADGKNYNTKFYNLDAIIAVGYSVNSINATPVSFGLPKPFVNFFSKALYWQFKQPNTFLLL